MIALALLAALVAPSNTWTVDDDGPADFTEIADAIAKVGSGDVLLVEPGTYGPFHLAKRLTILGRAGTDRPRVTSIVTVSASSFTIAGLDLDGLRITGAPDRGRIDDCRINVAFDQQQEFALVIDGCAQLVVSRTTVHGSKSYSQSHPTAGGSGMQILTSNVTLVDCQITGAQGYTSPFSSPQGGAGGIGLSVGSFSQVVSAGSTIQGGQEGWATCVFCDCHDGPAGPGIKLEYSTLILRGSSGDKVIAGLADPECPPILSGLALDAGNSVIVTSGVVVQGQTGLGNSESFLPDPAEPYLDVQGPDSVGAHKTIRLSGPAGASCLLAASLAPAYAPLGQFDGNLWVGLSGFFVLVPFVTQGQQNPIALGFHVPASLEGLEGVAIEMQPFFPGLPSAYAPGQSIAGNVAEIILRF